MPSCSPRSSSAARPTSPKPALLTMNCGSSAWAASASPIRAAAPGCARSSASTSGFGPPARGDLGGQFVQPLLAPRHQHQGVAMAGEDARQLGADAGRGAGDERDRRHAPLAALGGDAVAQRDALRRRHAEQIGDAPDQVVLELRSRAVGVGDRPHHLDHAQPLGFVERAVELTGEVIKIDGLLVGGGGLRDQLVGRGIIEFEALLQQALQLVAFGIGHLAVDRGGMDQQRGRGEAQVMIAEALGRLLAAREIGDEAPDGVEQEFLRTGENTSPRVYLCACGNGATAIRHGGRGPASR